MGRKTQKDRQYARAAAAAAFGFTTDAAPVPPRAAAQQQQQQRTRNSHHRHQATAADAALASRTKAKRKPVSWLHVGVLLLIVGGGLQILLPIIDRFRLDDLIFAPFSLLAPLVAWMPYVLSSPTHVELSATAQPADPSLALAQVFFGGEPWLVLCTDCDAKGNPLRGAHRATKPHPVFLEAAELGMAAAARSASGSTKSFRSATLRCLDKLPSGVSTVERFRLASTTTSSSGGDGDDEDQLKQQHSAAGRAPLAFFVGNGDHPRRIPAKYLPTSKLNKPAVVTRYAKRLAKAVIDKTAVRIVEAKSSAQLANGCFAMDTKGTRAKGRRALPCALLLVRGAYKELPGDVQRSISRMAARQRATRFVLVNTRKMRMQLPHKFRVPRLSDPDVPQWPRVLLFRPVPPALRDREGSAVLSLGMAHDGEFSVDAVDDFITRALAAHVQAQDLHKKNKLLSSLLPFRKLPVLKKGSSSSGNAKKRQASGAASSGNEQESEASREEQMRQRRERVRAQREAKERKRVAKEEEESRRQKEKQGEAGGGESSGSRNSAADAAAAAAKRARIARERARRAEMDAEGADLVWADEDDEDDEDFFLGGDDDEDNDDDAEEDEGDSEPSSIDAVFDDEEGDDDNDDIIDLD